MAFVEDLDAFVDPAEHGTSAVYTPLGGDADDEVDVDGLFLKDYDEPLGEVEGNAPRFACPVASLTDGGANGAILVIGAATYHVVNTHPDGTGMVTLVLQKQ